MTLSGRWVIVAVFQIDAASPSLPLLLNPAPVGTFLGFGVWLGVQASVMGIKGLVLPGCSGYISPTPAQVCTFKHLPGLWGVARSPGVSYGRKGLSISQVLRRHEPLLWSATLWSLLFPVPSLFVHLRQRLHSHPIRDQGRVHLRLSLENIQRLPSPGQCQDPKDLE